MLDMFQRFRSLFTKSLSAPDAELQAIFGAVPSGLGVGAATALTVPAVQSAIRLLSEAAACLTPRVMRRVGGVETEAPDHPVAALLGNGPNSWQSTYEFCRDMVSAALTNDKGALALVTRVDGGRVFEIARYEPSNFQIDYSTDGRREPTYRVNNQPIAADDLIHLRGPFDRCALSLAADAIGVAKTLEEHAGRLFKNGARPSGILSFKERMTPEAIRRARDSFILAHSNGNSGGTAIMDGGATYAQLAMLSTDAEFTANRTFQLQEIARAFRVPPTMIYELSRGTYSNTEAMGREFLVFSLEPWLQAFEGAMRRGLFSPEEQREYLIRFDRDDLTRASLTERATAIASLIASRAISPNEGRDWLEMSPREGGDVFENPNTGASQPGGQIGAAAPRPTPDQREDDA